MLPFGHCGSIHYLVSFCPEVHYLCGVDLAMSLEFWLLNWTWCHALESAELAEIKLYKSIE